MLADYGSTGLTVSTHPLALLRERLPAGVATSRELESLPHGSRVRVGGLVVARQRPGTAKGIVFLLLEDEFGTINLIVPPDVYERHRLTVRTEPLMLATGRLEKLAAAGGVINVLVSDVDSIAAPDRMVAEIKDFSMLDEGVRRGLAAAQAAGAQMAVGAGAAPAPPGGRGRTSGGRSGSGPDQHGDASEAEDFRAVAPAVMSFGSGRRR
jgi:error-prone DNA polymerase